MPPPPGTSDSEPSELHKAPDGKQGSGIPKKNQHQGLFLCCKDFQVSRGEDRERFHSSHRCAGKVGKSHGAWCDTVMAEGLDTTRKAGRIPKEPTFGRELLQSQGKMQCGLEEIACLRSRFAFGTWIRPQAAGKSGKMWEVLAE